MEKTVLLLLAAAIVLGVVVLVACRAGEDYGRLQPSDEVTKDFEGYRLNPARAYYQSGPDAYPGAVIGVDQRFSMEAGLWKKAAFTEDTFKETIQGMQAKARRGQKSLHGFEILNARGERVGEWYSVPGLHVVIRMKGPDRVEISTPPSDTWKEEP